MDYFLIATLALVPTLLTLILKIAFLRRVGGEIYGNDSYFYMLFTDIIRQDRHRIPMRISVFLGSDLLAIPPLLQWVASFIGRKRLEQWQAFIPIIIKVLITYLLSATTGFIFYSLNPAHLLEAIIAASVAGLLYGFSPINRNANPDNLSDFTFGPRSLGALLAASSCIAMVAGIILHSISLYVVAVLLIALTCLSSYFAIQAVVLILLITLIILRGWTQLLLLPLGIMLAVPLSKGYYWTALVQHVQYMWLYAIKLSKENVAYIRSVFTTLDLPRAVWYLLTGRLGSLTMLVRNDVILKGLTMYPVHLVCGVALLVDPAFWVMNQWFYPLAILWFSSMIVFTVTSLPWFKFIGEADRYLEFAGFFPATILSVAWLVSPAGASGEMRILILIALFVWYELICRIYPPPMQTSSKDKRELWGVLGKLAKAGGRVVSIPLTDAPEFIYRANIPSLWPLPLVPSTAHLIYKYPIPLLDFGYISQHFGINYVVVYKRYLSDKEIEKAISNMDLVYENAEHQVFRLVGKNDPH